MTDDTFETSLKTATEALQQIKAHRVPANPQNYELWYTYARGSNQKLNEALNEIKASGKPITPDEAERVYEAHVAPQGLSERVEEVGALIGNEIDEVAKMIDEALSSSGSYSSSLEEAVKALRESSDPSHVATIVRTLVSATTEMQQHNRDLESRLVESRGQITELQQNLETVRRESLTDALTGIANRKQFDHMLRQMTKAAETTKRPFSLVLCDIDHFKSFNDKHGHQTGDQVLRLVGHTLRASLRGNQLPARYGGEEFAILLPQSDLKAAGVIAEQIRRSIRGKELVKRSTGEALGRITMSFGVAEFGPGKSGEELIRRADVCLYAAKAAGRDRVKDERDPDVAGLPDVA